MPIERGRGGKGLCAHRERKIVPFCEDYNVIKKKKIVPADREEILAIEVLLKEFLSMEVGLLRKDAYRDCTCRASNIHFL